jgi:hypothetical protein
MFKKEPRRKKSLNKIQRDAFNTLQSLPNELWQGIISKLSLSELLEIRLISQRFRANVDSYIGSLSPDQMLSRLQGLTDPREQKVTIKILEKFGGDNYKETLHLLNEKLKNVDPTNANPDLTSLISLREQLQEQASYIIPQIKTKEDLEGKVFISTVKGDFPTSKEYRRNQIEADNKRNKAIKKITEGYIRQLDRLENLIKNHPLEAKLREKIVSQLIGAIKHTGDYEKGQPSLYISLSEDTGFNPDYHAQLAIIKAIIKQNHPIFSHRESKGKVAHAISFGVITTTSTNSLKAFRDELLDQIEKTRQMDRKLFDGKRDY